MLPTISQGMFSAFGTFLNSRAPLASRASGKICWNRSISKSWDSLAFPLYLESAKTARWISEGHKETKDSKSSDLEKEGLSLCDSQ